MALAKGLVELPTSNIFALSSMEYYYHPVVAAAGLVAGLKVA